MKPQKVESNRAKQSLRYFVVHNGARDVYQIALSLYEVGKLGKVITDFYSPDWLMEIIPSGSSLHERFKLRRTSISSSYFINTWILQTLDVTYHRLKGVKSIRHLYHRQEKILGKVCLKIAKLNSEPKGLLCYSYYWREISLHPELKNIFSPIILFQVHPFNLHIREIIRRDREKTGLTYYPEREELDIDDPEVFLHSLGKTDHIIAASHFTARGLVKYGCPSDKITVVPYANTLSTKVQRNQEFDDFRWENQLIPLKLLWVGSISYRKGLHHLLQAMNQFNGIEVQLSVVSGSKIPLELTGLFPQNVKVYNRVDNRQLVEMYRSHHLFILPSMIEGFGLVYMEALSNGLPIICTSNTGGADIIEHGEEGYIIQPGSSEAIVEILQEILSNTDRLPEMSVKAKIAAKKFTWERFRRNIQMVVDKCENNNNVD